MEYEAWLGWYKQILEDFGYDENEDKKSAKILAALLLLRELTGLSIIDEMIRNKKILITAPSINGISMPETADFDTIICADDAIALLHQSGILPDIIVTDLDGDVRKLGEANKNGSIAVIHAHGDNITQIRKYVPGFEGKIVGTTQGPPLKNIHNFGGFTDGDRAVLLAAHFGAKKITLTGFDFENPVPKQGKDLAVKRKKLKWAKILIEAVERPSISYL